MIVNYRPEYTPAWGPRRLPRRVALEPLGEADTREMLRDLAGEDPSLDGLGELIHERTQGNPFFIEEIVRELDEAGYLEGERGSYRLVRPLEDTGVPVDGAGDPRRPHRPARRRRQAAAAGRLGGRQGSRRARAAPDRRASRRSEIEPLLCELTESGFLYEAELYPEKILAFRHPLTREVAYGTQLGDRREATHAAAARAIVELKPDRHDELAALIAHHMAAGGEPLEAARWYARAAYWTGSSQPAEAMRLWQRGDRACRRAGGGRRGAALALISRILQLDFAWRLGNGPRRGRRLAPEAEEIAERTGDLARWRC